MGIRKSRRTAFAAVSAVAVALAAASTASAETKTPTAPAKKGCEVQLKGPGAGQSIVYADGYSFSVHGSNDGKTHTYTCNDGTWKETVSLTAGGTLTGALTIPVAQYQVLTLAR
jgi:Spy/CpxP family protein refolding chaperone